MPKVRGANLVALVTASGEEVGLRPSSDRAGKVDPRSPMITMNTGRALTRSQAARMLAILRGRTWRKARMS